MTNLFDVPIVVSIFLLVRYSLPHDSLLNLTCLYLLQSRATPNLRFMIAGFLAQ